MDHSGGPTYITERLDVFSNMIEGKGGLLFSEEFILIMINLVRQDHSFKLSLIVFWPIFLLMYETKEQGNNKPK